MEIVRVRMNVGELDVVQLSGEEGADDLIKPGTAPRHVGLGDCRRFGSDGGMTVLV